MYAKLFASIYQGTLRGNTRCLVVFTNLLAHADKEGWADIHPRSIAEEVGLSIGEVQAAIDELEAPDPESRSPELDGRRIVRLDEHRAWGWQIVNHGKYRAIRSEDDRREQNRLAQERFRAKRNAESNKSKQSKPPSAHTDTDTDTDKRKSMSRKRAKSPLPSDFSPSERVKAWANEKGFDRLDEHCEAFKRKCAAGGYAYADHDSAFMEAIREDWAKLRGNGRVNGSAPAPAPVSDGSIKCESCGTRTRQYTGRQCNPCWRGVINPRVAA